MRLFTLGPERVQPSRSVSYPSCKPLSIVDSTSARSNRSHALSEPFAIALTSVRQPKSSSSGGSTLERIVVVDSIRLKFTSSYQNSLVSEHSLAPILSLCLLSFQSNRSLPTSDQFLWPLRPTRGKLSTLRELSAGSPRYLPWRSSPSSTGISITQGNISLCHTSLITSGL